jgi:hypothetical protein
VLPSGLQIFPYHMGNMHNVASKIREDTTVQTLLNVKQTIEILPSENWIMGLVWTTETNDSRAQEFFKICTLVEQTRRNTLSFGSVV